MSTSCTEPTEVPSRAQVIILGGGISGIAVAIGLLSQGIRDFVILEKADQLGGTWRDNTYPGCGCDVPSQLYSFSFAPNPNWSRVFAGHQEIQQYLLDVASQYDLTPFFRFGAEVTAARWIDEQQSWAVETSKGKIIGQFLVGGAGPLHTPKVPRLPGLESFRGVQFHTARWNHDYDLAEKRVAVIGSGCSAIQLIPKIQPDVDRLVLFQRTASWILPRLDCPIPRVVRTLFRYLPAAQRVFRGLTYYNLEMLQLAQRRPAIMKQLQRIGLAQLRLQVADPELRQNLTPDFVMGCKRIMFSNNYFPAVRSSNVDVVPCGVQRVHPHGVESSHGEVFEVDAIVFATGFHVLDAPINECVYGRSGKSLAEEWEGSPQAYLGTTVTGFPNLFLVIGPNMGNGHGSAFAQIEAQANYITHAVKLLAGEQISSLEVRREVQTEYNERVQIALSTSVWNTGGCASYYLDRNGKNSSIYPWTTIHLRRSLARFDPAPYILRRPDHSPSGQGNVLCQN